jgi:hypothetical protein
MDCFIAMLLAMTAWGVWVAAAECANGNGGAAISFYELWCHAHFGKLGFDVWIAGFGGGEIGFGGVEIAFALIGQGAAIERLILIGAGG